MDDPVEVVPAAQVDGPTLLELTASLRRALRDRGEHLPREWPEEAVTDLRRGTLEGVVLRTGAEALALGILSTRPHRAFGQVHLAAASGRVALARSTLEALVARAPSGTARVDFGLTGLSTAEEEALAGALGRVAGFESLRRFGLFRPLQLDHPPEAGSPPAGYRFVPVGESTAEALARLDWEAFHGSPDAAFISDTVEGNLRLVRGILAGQLGRFLEEASSALLAPDGKLAAFVLTVEESPRVGVFVDLAVDPAERRHGLGRALLGRGLRALVALGHTGARLWVTETNTPARALYAASGFQLDSTAYVYRWRAPGPAA